MQQNDGARQRLSGSIDPHPENGAFISACGYHTGGWSWLKIDGDWQHEAFTSWYTALGSGNTSRKRVWHEVHTSPCAACCKATDGGPELEMGDDPFMAETALTLQAL